MKTLTLSLTVLAMALVSTMTGCISVKRETAEPTTTTTTTTRSSSVLAPASSTTVERTTTY